MDSWQNGCILDPYMAKWIHGKMDSWQNGSKKSLDSWQNGFMAVWIHGTMDVWQFGFMALWMNSSLDSWHNGCIAVWIHGTMDVWQFGCMVFSKTFPPPPTIFHKQNTLIIISPIYIKCPKTKSSKTFWRLVAFFRCLIQLIDDKSVL